MECADIRDAFARGDIPSGAEVERHTAGCEACAELVAGGPELGLALGGAERDDQTMPAASDALLAAVREDVKKESGLTGWLRSRPTSTRVALALAAAAAVALLNLIAMKRADLGVYPLGRMIALVALHALIVGLIMRQALLGLQSRPASGGLRAVLVLAAVALPLAVAAMPQAHALHPASLAGDGDDFVKRGVTCFVFGLVMAAPIGLLLLGLDRGGHRALPRVMLAAAGSGLAGALALQLHCPITHQAHLFVGHATVLVALLAAYAATWRILRASA